MMTVVFRSDDLEYASSYDRWSELVDDFLESIRDIVISQVVHVHGVSNQDANFLVKIRNYDYTSFEVGIIDTESYSRRLKEIVLEMLIKERGSFEESVFSDNLVWEFCSMISGSIPIMWTDFVETAFMEGAR